MKKIIPFLILFAQIMIVSTDAFGQDSEKLAAIEEIISDTSFVLEADMLFNRNNQQFIPQASGNLMLVHKDTLIIQTSSPTDIGLNGIGGFTALCDITDYEVTKNQSNFSITISISSGILGMGTVYFNLSDPDYARARFQGAFGQRFSFRGKLMRLEESREFIGSFDF